MYIVCMCTGTGVSQEVSCLVLLSFVAVSQNQHNQYLNLKNFYFLFGSQAGFHGGSFCSILKPQSVMKKISVDRDLYNHFVIS